MSVHLLPCSGCSRHVRASESACPFCGTAIQAAEAPRGPAGRLGRAATFAFGAAVATTLSVAGCESTVHTSTDSGAEADAQADVDSGADVDAQVGLGRFDRGLGLEPQLGLAITAGAEFRLR